MARPPRTLPMSDKGKGKSTAGFAFSLPEVVPPSAPSMEALMTDQHLFEEPLLKDLKEEVVSDLASEFGALVIKKVIDLLRD